VLKDGPEEEEEETLAIQSRMQIVRQTRGFSRVVN
jgi:hypothetical protein